MYIILYFIDFKRIKTNKIVFKCLKQHINIFNVRYNCIMFSIRYLKIHIFLPATADYQSFFLPDPENSNQVRITRVYIPDPENSYQVRITRVSIPDPENSYQVRITRVSVPNPHNSYQVRRKLWLHQLKTNVKVQIDQ